MRPRFKTDYMGHGSSRHTRYDDDPRRGWFELGLSFGRELRKHRHKGKRRGVLS
jgi:hypothetical protein